MIEYTNGQFGTIAPAKEILEMLQKLPTLDEIKAIHIGTASELQEIRLGSKSVDTLSERIAELEKEMRRILPIGRVKVFQMEDIP